MKKSFMLYCDQYEPIKDLTDTQKAQLLDAIFCYNCCEDVNTNDPMVKAVFGFFKATFDRDKEKYLKRCEINKKNGSTGGKRTQANATERKQNKANQADRDRDSERDSVSEKESDKEKKENTSQEKLSPEEIKERFRILKNVVGNKI